MSYSEIRKLEKTIARLQAEIRNRDRRIIEDLETSKKGHEKLFFKTHEKLFSDYEEKIEGLAAEGQALGLRLSDRQNEVLSLLNRLSAREDELSTLRLLLSTQEDELSTLKNRNFPSSYEDLESSIVVGALRQVQRLVEGLFPYASRRRQHFNSTLATLQRALGTREDAEAAFHASPRATAGSPLPVGKSAPVPSAEDDALLEGIARPVDVLFVNHEETRTGAPKILYEIARSSLDDHRCVVLSVKQGSARRDFTEAFPKLIRADEMHPRLNEIQKARHLLKKLNPRLVYVNSICAFVYAIAATDLGIRTVFHIHELENGIAQTLGYQGKNLAKMADVFVAVSKPVEKLLVERYKCHPDRVRLIYEFIDHDEISGKVSSDAPQEFLGAGGESNGNINIVGVGSFTYRKGVDLFIKLAAELRHSDANLRFTWVGGGGNGMDALAHFRQSFAHAFTHIEETHNPYPYIAHADIVLLPSREDPFPLVVLEALSLDRPVIAFRHSGGAYEAIGEHGCVVESLDYRSLKKSVLSFVEGFAKKPPRERATAERIRPYTKDVVLPQIKTLIRECLHD